MGGRNLLRNPSFESVKGGVPVHWHRIYNEVLSGPFSVVTDSFEGKRAVRLETEEWNFLRPQYIAQEVTLPKGAEYCRLSVYAKGRGLVSLCMQFRKDGRPLEYRKIDMGFGEQRIPVEVKSDFALLPLYERYEVFYEVPEGANEVLVKLGNTAGALDRLNIWGRCYIDRAVLIAGGGEILRPEPATEMPELKRSEELADIARFCQIRTEPPSLDRKALIDGDVETAPHYYRGVERGAINRFIFPAPLPLKAIKVYLNGSADSYWIRGDKEGDGVFESLLVRPCGLAGLKGWKSHFFRGERYCGILIQALSGRGVWSFRRSNPSFTEIQILTDKKLVKEEEFGRWSPNVLEYTRARNVPWIRTKPVEFKSPRPASFKFSKRVCADLWMWGVQYTKDTKKGTWTKEKIESLPIFKENVKILKKMRVDTIFIDLTNASCWDLMPWPSKVGRGIEDNVLKALIDALHDAGFKVITETLHNISPFETVKWHYPCEETSRYPSMKQYPSILYGEYVKEKWLQLYEEQIACGADGVCLGSDEFYYRGHFLETLPEDDAQRKDYERKYRKAPPKKEADTLDYRRWVAHTHEGLANLFAYWNSELKKRHPTLYTCTVFMGAGSHSNIYGEGVPFDLIGAKGGLDSLGGDYMDPWGIRLLSAVNGWRKVNQLFWGWYDETKPPILHIAKPLWMLMYGGGSCNYWRFYQLKIYDHTDSVRIGYEIVEDLEGLGVWEARPPKEIAVLSSRRSWDWWQIRAVYGTLPSPDTDRGISAMLGWFIDEFVNRTLIRSGYPYDWYFIDNPSHLARVRGYRVVLVPFPYSVSDETVKRIAEIAEEAKVVLFGAMGQTDEWGEPRKTPALKSLIDAGKVVLINEDFMEVCGDGKFTEKVLGIIDEALGDRNPFKFIHYGRRVDATLLSKNEKEKFVFLINWEEEPSEVDFSIFLPAGKYRVLMRDDVGWHQVILNGRTVLSHNSFKKLRRKVPPLKAEVYYIGPASKE